MKVTFRARALGHLRQIERYVAADSPAAAGRLVARIERAILNLADQPLSAPAAPCRARGNSPSPIRPTLSSIVWMRMASPSSPFSMPRAVRAPDQFRNPP